EQGVIGEITRTLCIDPWYRSQAYYDSGTWRATWKGEGGGVLLNQAPHAIDIFIWLAGLPCKVEAKTRTRLHKIEIEDEVCALLEYKNGAWGYYYTSTCEPGDFDLHMEIAGDKGKIIVNGKDITLYRYDIPVSKFTYKAKDMWASLPVREEKIDTGADIPAGHDSIIKNFARAILKKEKLFIPGEEGLKSIEFINACILSGKTGKPVNIPVNRKEYDRLIRKLVAMSRVKNVCNVQRLPDPRFLKQ
ncbi:MAG: Gfo/Idh/MocA family oxidoreductase, partial [bacterium]|nr:Gfo/Idh/MocA family oxidoreductase [bacterium]